jgi:hypothetical protein
MWKVMKVLVSLSMTLAFAGSTYADSASDLHPGPAAWREEYWDVKPDKFDEFVKTNREQVYSLARRVPGYRGYDEHWPDGRMRSAHTIETRYCRRTGKRAGIRATRLAHVTQKLFPHARNHWDMQYRAIETSLVPAVE